MKVHGLLLAGLLTAGGCSTAAPEAPPQAADLPDVTEAYRPHAVAHGECLVRTASSYARRAGSPRELGRAGAAACSRTREELRVAVTRARGDAWARGFMARLTEEEDARVIAQIVVDERQQRGRG